MNNTHDKSINVKAIIGGCSGGMLLGVGMGLGLAVLSGAFAGGFGWFVVLHTAFAMTLMGAWVIPCLLPDHDSGSPAPCLVREQNVESREVA
jgi:predicted lipid-binding transport protein (Tim44 family)